MLLKISWKTTCTKNVEIECIKPQKQTFYF